MHDFRSDTVTRPTPGMYRAMMDAELGDDVLGDDPTVKRLESEVACRFGKEAAAFVPSGTMANQAAIRSLTEPGDEIIAHAASHIYEYEGGAPAALSGCGFRFVHSPDGLFEADDVRGAMRARDDHAPRSRLLVIENTHNRGGGRVWPVAQVERVTAAARELGLRCHLDGARLFNACVASGAAPESYARHFDTVSTCFSKGLGAPVGSIVTGSVELIGRVRRFRKMFGGSMRQSGLLAAAALYALEHHVERLAEDHANARALSEGLSRIPGFAVSGGGVETNIVYFDVSPEVGDALSVCRGLEHGGVRMLDVGSRTVRAVTHLDVGGAGVARALEVLWSLSREVVAS